MSSSNGHRGHRYACVDLDGGDDCHDHDHDLDDDVGDANGASHDRDTTAMNATHIACQCYTVASELWLSCVLAGLCAIYSISLVTAGLLKRTARERDEGSVLGARCRTRTGCVV